MARNNIVIVECDRIATLEAENTQLREALAPFANTGKEREETLRK